MADIPARAQASRAASQTSAAVASVPRLTSARLVPGRNGDAALTPSPSWRGLVDGALVRLADYAELAKLRIATLVLLTVTIGFALGSEDRFSLVPLLHTLFGVTLAAAGSSALNQWVERRADGLMHRTRERPLPAGRVAPREALAFGLLTGFIGPAWLAIMVNPVVAGWTLLTVALYSAVYTPLKPKTFLCTAIGAIPGALPPVLGWAAAQGRVSHEAFGLFAILFLWQFPHFLAIAWLYREDYARAGMKMVPATSQGRSLAGLLSVAYAAALVPASLLPKQAGLAGTGYAAAALVLGAGYLFASLAFWKNESTTTARRLLWTSLIYLPALLVILAWDHYRLLW